jgi:hypothetical protein
MLKGERAGRWSLVREKGHIYMREEDFRNTDEGRAAYESLVATDHIRAEVAAVREGLQELEDMLLSRLFASQNVK